METGLKNSEQGAFAMLDPNGGFTQYGLTKREYMATQIAIGLSVQAIAGRHNMPEEMAKTVPYDAVLIADGLIRALEEK